MTDRDKIINDIEKAKKQSEEYALDRIIVPFKEADIILALLKEQEPVEPIKPIDIDDSFTYLCSNCKGELFCGDRIRDKYCSTCGRAVNWKIND